MFNQLFYGYAGLRTSRYGSSPVAPPSPTPTASAPVFPTNVEGVNGVASITINWQAVTHKVDGSACVPTLYTLRWGPNPDEQYKGGPSEIAGRITTVSGVTLTKTQAVAAGAWNATVSCTDADGGEGAESFDVQATAS